MNSKTESEPFDETRKLLHALAFAEDISLDPASASTMERRALNEFHDEVNRDNDASETLFDARIIHDELRNARAAELNKAEGWDEETALILADADPVVISYMHKESEAEAERVLAKLALNQATENLARARIASERRNAKGLRIGETLTCQGKQTRPMRARGASRAAGQSATRTSGSRRTTARSTGPPGDGPGDLDPPGIRAHAGAGAAS